MFEALNRLVEEAGALHSKLVLLVGEPHSGKSALLCALASKRGLAPLCLGADLGSKLAVVPQGRRQLQIAPILRQLIDGYAKDNLVLIDNIELLFDRSLQLDPLELLKRHAHARRVVAVWPGELQGDARTGRLTYADMGHPEHQDYSLAGVVPFEIQ